MKLLIQLVLATAFFSSSSAVADICSRNEIIVYKLTNILRKDCNAIENNDLASVTELSLNGFYKDLRSLKRSDFSGLRSLRELDLIGNDIPSGGDFLEDLSSLRILRMGSSAFQTQIPKLSGLSALEILVITGNQWLTSVEIDDLSLYPSLKELTLSNNRISKVMSGAFRRLTRLEKLDLSRNGKITFPHSELRGLSSLREVNFYDAHLSQLPDLQDLKLLEKLDFSRNSLNKLAQTDLGILPALKSLNLSENHIVDIEERAFVGLTSLNDLFLSGNELIKLSQRSFEGLTSLQRLFLTNNEIKILKDPVFRDLKSLQVLTLEYNDLGTIKPGVFVGLTQRLHLGLSHNNLTEIEVSLAERTGPV